MCGGGVVFIAEGYVGGYGHDTTRRCAKVSDVCIPGTSMCVCMHVPPPPVVCVCM